jgi:hypothetical protein
MMIRSPWHLPAGRTVPLALFLLGASFLLHLGLAAWGLYRRSHPALPSLAARTSLALPLAKSPAPPKATQPQPTPPAPDLFLSHRGGPLDIRPPWLDALDPARALAPTPYDATFRAIEATHARSPMKPEALAELAGQYEKQGKPELAVKLWEKVFACGPSSGILFQVADAKLQLLKDRKPNRPAPAQSPSPVASSPSPNAAPLSPQPKPGLLRFGKVSSKESPGAPGKPRGRTLSIPVTRAENSRIDPQQVAIQVQFYDLVNGKTVERSDAEVAWNWSREPVDWAMRPTQTLQVHYTLRTTPAPSVPSKDRHYHGFVAGIYYQDKLLDTRAEPARLGHQYPLSRGLSRDPAP